MKLQSKLQMTTNLGAYQKIKVSKGQFISLGKY